MSIIVTIQHVNHCYDSACPSLLQFSMSNNVTIQPVTHCYNSASQALLQFSLSRTVTIQHFTHCYNSACQTLLQFSMSSIVTIQHVNHCYNSACQSSLQFSMSGTVTFLQAKLSIFVSASIGSLPSTERTRGYLAILPLVYYTYRAGLQIHLIVYPAFFFIDPYPKILC